MIYHLLPETEVFSASLGGAIALNVANMVRNDAQCSVVCQRADASWDQNQACVLVAPLLRYYARIKGRRFLPRWFRTTLLRLIFRPVLSKLKAGDIVWSHDAPFFCEALGGPIRRAGAGLIYHSHNLLEFYRKFQVFRNFQADAFIFISDAMREEGMALFPWIENSYVVHNGADETLFYPATARSRTEDSAIKVLYVGRLFAYKGAHVLSDAMKLLQERGVNTHCRIVGSFHAAGGKTTAYMRSLVRNAPSNVEFRPFKSGKEIADEFRAADIFCCPSIWQEPFGNVNIEAMACGVPVVASRVGGIPEIGADGGIVFVDPDSAEQLADALQHLAENDALRTQVGAAGRMSFLRRFTWKVILGQYMQIATEVRSRLSERGRA